MFVTFEGIEGAGKSTAIDYLSSYLQARGHDPVLTREPGGSALGRRLRALLLDVRTGSIASRAELFLFLADRAQHVAEVIRPALEAGQVVLCDRFTDSTLAYQGYGRGLDTEYLRSLNTAATGGLAPDLTLLLDLPVRCGLERAGQRNRSEGMVIAEGRFDREIVPFGDFKMDETARLSTLEKMATLEPVDPTYPSITAAVSSSTCDAAAAVLGRAPAALDRATLSLV